MKTQEGELFKNKITKDLFKIKKVENEKVVMLEHEKGFIRIWLPSEHLEFFFEKVNPVRKGRPR